jgi:hypothetical protein
MGWKEWPAWVKGGLVGFLIGLLYFFWVLYLNRNNPDGIGLWEKAFGGAWGSIVLLLVYIVIICSVALCALIGWIVGRVKAKKEES